MDLKLVERFLQAMMPPEGMSTIHTAFECLRGPPEQCVPAVGLMIGKFQGKIYGPEVTESQQASAVGILLTGIMIGWASEQAELKKYIIEDYLERNSKLRGENVVSFFDKKAGR